MSFTVMVVEDEETFRHNAERYLSARGFEIIGVGTLSEAREHLQKGTADVVVLDARLPDGYGPDLLYEVSNLALRPPIILITGNGDIEMAVEAMKNGAHDFIAKPLQFAQLEKSINRACEIVSMRRELAHFRNANSKLNFIPGKSPQMELLYSHARRAATAGVSVLITGETGTGKEVVASYIHRSSPRANKPFIAINCAAIQSTMLESELFGYEAGAFTGAEKRKHGLIEIAEGGVLFLDEICSMPLDIQAKLLRVLEDRSFRRLGATALIKVDILLMTASNRELKAMIRDGLFREDLYYRLNVIELNLPPLRERREDIPELVGFFMRQSNAKMGMNVLDVSPRAMEALSTYAWPGNIRELSNALERAMLFCNGEIIDVMDLPADVTRPRG